MTNPTPTPTGAAAELPVVGYVSDHQLAGPWTFAVISPVERLGEDETALTPHAPAQSQLDALREEVARLTKERDAAFAMSRCECSADEACANLVKLQAELAAIKAQPTDVDALMALAKKYAEATVMLDRSVYMADCMCSPQTAREVHDAAREALRAKLAARKEEL